MGLSDRRRLDVHMKTSDQPRKAIVKRNKFFFSRFFQHFLETTLPTFITGSYFLLSPRRAPGPGPAYCFFVICESGGAGAWHPLHGRPDSLAQARRRRHLFVLDLLHKPFQVRHCRRFTSVVSFIRFKQSHELFHYALGGKWVVGTLRVGKRSEVCGGMTKPRRDSDRMSLCVQHVVREFNEWFAIRKLASFSPLLPSSVIASTSDPILDDRMTRRLSVTKRHWLSRRDPNRRGRRVAR